MLARVHYRLQIHLYTSVASIDKLWLIFSAMQTQSASVVGGVLSLIIILIIGGSALGFTILILKNRKLMSEKQ